MIPGVIGQSLRSDKKYLGSNTWDLSEPHTWAHLNPTWDPGIFPLLGVSQSKMSGSSPIFPWSAKNHQHCIWNRMKLYKWNETNWDELKPSRGKFSETYRNQVERGIKWNQVEPTGTKSGSTAFLLVPVRLNKIPSESPIWSQLVPIRFLIIIHSILRQLFSYTVLFCIYVIAG